MSTGRDRRGKLAAQHRVNGIDFVEVLDTTQTRLRVHFVTKAPAEGALRRAVSGVEITGGDGIPVVEVKPDSLDWGTGRTGRPTLDLAVTAPGDFSMYTLRLIREPRGPAVLDPFFDRVRFSFKAGCPSTLDCEVPQPECLPDGAPPPIDYLAKDFLSFKRALSEFSALRYPAWQERSEADFGVMFMEALASIADDLSYQQDRVAAEGWLETATERRSLVRLARIVDYEPRVATASRTMLEMQVSDGEPMGAGEPVAIKPGVVVSALAPDGTLIPFETGTGLGDEATYEVRPEWNELLPHWWDDAEQCLPSGATEMWIVEPEAPLSKGQRVLIQTRAKSAGDPPTCEIVKLEWVDPTATTDPLLNKQVIRIKWRAQDALRSHHDLQRTHLGANLVPATQGRRAVEQFVTSRRAWTRPRPATPRAVARTGPNGALQFLHTLANAPLAWLPQDSPLERPRPEVRLVELRAAGNQTWHFTRRLLDPARVTEVFTVDPVRYRTTNASLGTADYDGDEGETIRFGDGVFGAVPTDGATFEVTYRSGGGARGNVGANTINRIDPNNALTRILTVTNPLPASGGGDAEPAYRVREMAPQDFRARQYRAVRAEDYEKAATTLPWVQRAGTAFRWTGSWLTVFTAVDPRASASLAPGPHAELTELLDRYRLAGYESYAVPPRYAAFDLRIIVCARSDAFRGDAERAVRETLDTTRHVDGTLGFFHPDRFTFGMTLERSTLEAAVQEAAGVDGVIEIFVRRRGHTPGWVVMPDFVTVASDEIVRVDGDPKHAEHGSLHVEVRGGK